MTKEEIEKKIEEIEGRLWFIKMGDTWDNDDRRITRQLTIRKQELEEELKKCS